MLCAESEPLALGPKVVETLLALIERGGAVASKTELLDRIWPEGFVEEANLAQNIYVIRKTLRAHWPQNVIETVPRRGYRFTAPVRLEHDSSQAVPFAPRHAPVAAPARFRIAAAAACLFALAIGAAAFAAARPHGSAMPGQGLSATGARLYAMGRYYWNQRTAAGIEKSRRYFAQVTSTDPRDSRGYSGLASAYAIAGDYGYGSLRQKDALALAARFARKAIALNGGSAEAYAVLGLVSVDRHQMHEGFAQYRRALALDPKYAPAHQWYGSALLLSGKALAGYRELNTAANLDPSSVAAADWLAQAAFISRRYGDAVAYGRQALDLSPQRYGANETIGMAYEALGNERAAIAIYKAYARRCTDCRYDAAALLAHAYARAHDAAGAQSELRIARAGLAMHAVSYDNFLAALIANGEKSEALALLRRGKFDEPAALLAIDPRMDGVRGDLRFRRYTQSPG
ncbi:MAG: winged helix-turn-helix domain-containing protein [Candidatus Baltobacteraceae bacterium]